MDSWQVDPTRPEESPHFAFTWIWDQLLDKGTPCHELVACIIGLLRLLNLNVNGFPSGFEETKPREIELRVNQLRDYIV